MLLKNKLGINNEIELAKEEERISKLKAQVINMKDIVSTKQRI